MTEPTQTRGAFPEGVTVPVQYGKRTSAFVLHLLHYQNLVVARKTVRSLLSTARKQGWDMLSTLTTQPDHLR